MLTLQLQAIVPEDGNLSVSLPMSLRGKTVKLNVVETEPQDKQPPPSIDFLWGALKGMDIRTDDIRDEGDREL
jgi:hypothetical protein